MDLGEFLEETIFPLTSSVLIFCLIKSTKVKINLFRIYRDKGQRRTKKTLTSSASDGGVELPMVETSSLEISKSKRYSLRAVIAIYRSYLTLRLLNPSLGGVIN